MAWSKVAMAVPQMKPMCTAALAALALDTIARGRQRVVPSGGG
ncbi:hypothetical protein [Thiomonas sp. X19]|nr:hypothetical protein [Thiomonas sp. X19]